MKFQYFDGPQRSPEWFKLRLARPTASRLSDWTGVNKRTGEPLKARLDYEKELMFEKTFQAPFDKYVNSAMQDGVDFEEIAVKQYEAITGNKVSEVGAWFNEYFLASPDGKVGEDGLVECKVLKDNKFSEVLYDGVPDEHWQQAQGQLFASGRKWCDYVAINFTTRKVKIIRVFPNKAYFKELEVSLKTPLSTAEIDQSGVHDFQEIEIGAPLDNVTLTEITIKELDF